MAAIETHDAEGGVYLSGTPGGACGYRAHADRRYWFAWACIGWHKPDCLPGVMDDYGTLVPVPRPTHLSQQ